MFSLCGSVGTNTGRILCDRRRGIPKKVVIGSKVFAPSDYASQSTFDAAFQAAFKLSTGDANKLYPFPEITGVADNTDANKDATLGAFGPKVTLIEGKPAYTFDVVAGIQEEKELRRFNGQQVPAYIIDDANATWGKVDSAGNFSGYTVLVQTTSHKFGDGQNGQTTKVSISFASIAEFSDSAAFIETNLSLSDMEGLLDVTLAEYAAHATNVYKIKGFIPSASPTQVIDLYDSYADLLAQSTMWRVYTGSTFTTPMTITSVAKNAANKGWDITLDSTAFTALATGAKIKITLADPTTLDAAGVTGVEGVALIVTK